ncbi:pex14_N domain-containing protein [Trichonephila clavata]|uniref:Peroxisomal membrane protein PEX14 n=1 Tax=Trichonephila clavata TaxID=2740835 RepID=A0A8X6HW69_TRICU|nr:pex14_N domain-containing protein [Trichonephila clavata]
MPEDSNGDYTKNTMNIPNRPNLVDTAVNFLLNPEVKHRPDNSKVAFLVKKGLTDSEIAEAFDKVKSDSSFNTYPNRNDQLEKAYSLPQYQKALSFWPRLNAFSSSFIIIAVALYGLHHFYKNSAYMPIPMAISDVKTEISSVKSLLINRHQFPAIPKVCSPSIPLWQLRDSESENSNSESKKETENEELTSKTTCVENKEKTENLTQDENFNSVSLKTSEDKDGGLIAEINDTESDSQDDSSNPDETNKST